MKMWWRMELRFSFIQVGVSPNFKLVLRFAPFTTLPGLAPARAAAVLVKYMLFRGKNTTFDGGWEIPLTSHDRTYY